MTQKYWLTALLTIVAVTACRVAEAQKPIVTVKVETEGLPLHFTVNDDKCQEISKQLEEIAAARLQVEFPLFQWKANRGANPIQGPVLIIGLIRDSVVSNQILMTCSYQLLAAGRVNLLTSSTSIYSDGESYPDLESMVDAVAARGKRSLNVALEPSQHDTWRGFIRQVRLSDNLILSGQTLVLPMPASDLRAAENSLFVAELTTILRQQPANANLHLKPGGPVPGPPLQGMQECIVTEFTFDGTVWKMWVAQIAQAIMDKKSMSVRAEHYYRRDVPFESERP